MNRRLLCNGVAVPLKAKAVDTLLLLIQHNGEVIEKDELMNLLWPDSFVEEANLTQNIYMLRKALGEGQFIETIPRRGYRFAAEVKEWDDSSDLIVIKEKTRRSLSYETETRQAADALWLRLSPAASTFSGPLHARRDLNSSQLCEDLRDFLTPSF